MFEFGCTCNSPKPLRNATPGFVAIRCVGSCPYPESDVWTGLWYNQENSCVAPTDSPQASRQHLLKRGQRNERHAKDQRQRIASAT